MKKTTVLSACLFALALVAAGRFSHAQGAAPKDEDAPQFTTQGQLLTPRNYREWVFLSSGIGMTYGPLSGSAATPENPPFENVFVNPAAYRSFLKTGIWPDGTTLVLEIRSSASKVSINKLGKVQEQIVGLEVEVKDSKRFPGKWSFFDMSDAVASAKPLPTSATCYTCHGQNGAVDNTFVQFYPTLIPTARKKGTFHESPAE